MSRPSANVHNTIQDRQGNGGGDQLFYLSKSEMLEEFGPPKFLRAMMFLLAFTVFGSVAWAAIAKIKETTKALGEIVPIGSVHAIQHLEGGIISDILITEGELVRRGQVLVRFDPTPAREELEAVRIRQVGLKLRAERLRAFAAGRAAKFPPVAAVTGHKSLREVERYIKDAAQIGLADAAIATVSKTETEQKLANPEGGLAKSRKK